MAGLLGGIRRLNGLGALSLAEPFGGGAGASLTLLYQEETPEIFINDADDSIHAFWWSVLNRPREFQQTLKSTRVNMTEWRRQRIIYRQATRQSRLRKGFATFYLNRCNRSGIIANGGPIGGIDQAGPWRLSARYNKDTLLDRCKKLVEYRSRIHVSGLDGLEFLSRLDQSSTMLFIDPPYYEKGRTLYLNALSDAYHESLAQWLKSRKNVAWVVTYDDCDAIRRLYRGWATVRPFSLRYTATERRSGRELLITPKWLRLPRKQASETIAW
ncbi:MAG: DNA adenine methylase [Candidatus Eisenbacteria bacterium]|nr:DNA adenine methylase [Candidatus Eisenbacteria bacterium]